MIDRARVALVLGLCVGTVACAGAEEWRLPAETNFLLGFPGVNDDGTVNMVVEIPAGTNAKWETTKSGDALEWELRETGRRIVDYLAYPANYGMIPRTKLPKELGGDGDPLDVVLLGPAIARGDVIAVHPIGVLELLDDGAQDDKIIAVPMEGPFAGVTNLEELESRYPGTAEILETWFAHYKGPGRIESKGFADRGVALEIVGAAADAFRVEATSGS
jgi:inorganic pyrophosphatase